MSQQHPLKPQEEAITYGDVFDIQGELAEKPVAPKDAAMMQIAENALLGETTKGCAADAMESAAMKNEKAGFVGPDDVNIHSAVTVKEIHLPGKRIITESIDNKVIGQYSREAPLSPGPSEQSSGLRSPITIGEALEATALTAGKKPVDWCDAAAIEAAEVIAIGRSNIIPGAQYTSTLHNKTQFYHQAKRTKRIENLDNEWWSELQNATEKLASDKAATKDDAEGVKVAEMRNDPMLTTHPAGIAASVATAARLNNLTHETTK
ncbi:hypothetical protein V6N11_045427 [Hibiscus sabdariffa]|uniref:SMP domain-containing protein n=1 Tax=Hibiscus sabdariffa TaxID=183260 RepID=A0ABR2Q0X5_9ROSI